MIFLQQNYEIVVSGEKWVGNGVKSTSQVINDLIEDSFENLILTIYIITNDNVFKTIKNALKRGVKVEIFMYKGEKFYKNIAPRIIELKDEFTNFKVYESNEEFIHAKVLISDKHNILIGSANLTKNGLSSNYELGILIDDENVCYNVERIIKRLII